MLASGNEDKRGMEEAFGSVINESAEGRAEVRSMGVNRIVKEQYGRGERQERDPIKEAIKMICWKGSWR